MWGNIAIAFLLAFIVAFMVTPYSIKLANKIGAIDIPKDERRMRKKSMPKLGGIAVITGFLVSIIYLLFVMNIEGSINLFGSELYWKKLLGILLGIGIITVTGIFDDVKTLKPWQKLLGQVLAAVVVVAFGVKIETVEIPFFRSVGFSSEIAAIITVIWIIGITNAINLIDGLDGLSSGIALISCVSLVIIFALNGSPIVSILMITSLIGALVGFLPFNFAPAKTFIGDTGSNFLGFILSVISILGVAKTYTAVVIALPILVLGLPILDVGMAIIRRMIKGRSIKAIFKADKGHLHHKLVQKGFSQKQAVLILYGLTSILGIIAVTLVSGFTVQGIICIAVAIIIWAIGYIYHDMKVRRNTMIPEETSKEDKN
jgi:UDP-GlcNAc:undecaprenyl-phosphate GlcNAc-1-phosphate transferase